MSARQPTPEHIEQLRDVKARYFRYVDTKQWDRLRGIFTDGAVFDGLWSSAASPDEFVANLQRNLGPEVLSVHQGYTAELDEVADGVVRATWAMSDYVVWPAGGRPYMGITIEGQTGMRGYGYYEEEYRLTDGGWRMSYMRLTRLAIEPVVDRLVPPDYPTLRPTSDWIA